jgi:SSS family solute:Na+ symporter
MIIYGVTENIISLMADQNYTQKYCSVPTEKEAKKSVWIGMLIYIPLTAVFLYIGTTLFAFYSDPVNTLGDTVTKGDEVFPYFIATQLPVGLRGLIISAIIAASMSTIDSALNCSATVLFTDFYKRYFNSKSDEKGNLIFLRLATITWGALGIFFALLLINAESALDTWWQISGIFGGGILGLFLVSIFNIRITTTQGILSVLFSVLIIIWGTFARELPLNYAWLECKIEPIIIGATGTAGMVIAAVLFSSYNKLKPAS